MTDLEGGAMIPASRRIALILSLSLIMLAPARAWAEEALTNEAVIRLVAAGLSEDLVVAKIQQASRTDFSLEVDDLISLRDQGVGDEVIEAMLGRSGSTPFGSDATNGVAPAAAVPGAAPGAAPGGYVWGSQEDLGFEAIKVALSTSAGDRRLRILRGEQSTTAMGYMMFMNYPGLEARERTSDRRPTLLVQSASPLTGGRYFFAKLDVDHDDGVRSLKVSSVGGRFKAMFGNSSKFLEPDEDWVIPYQVEEVGADLWRVTPQQDLVPGEYGWYVDLGTGIQQGGLYGFGVD